MKSEISLKLSLLIIGIGLVAFSCVGLFIFSFSSFDNNSFAKQPYVAEALSLSEKTDLTIPTRIKIPAINVSSPILSVGLTDDGAMAVPKRPDEAAWFNLGPRPGEAGSAVISGHYGWKNNIPAAFDNLYKLKKGDQVYVEDERGVTTIFVVREAKVYGESQNASDVFGSSDGKSHLNLITCAGVWDKTQKSYSNRIVVFADKLDSESSP